jgi:hypothetical protein
VLSSHFSPGLAPQAGQRIASTFLGLSACFIGRCSHGSSGERWSKLTTSETKVLAGSVDLTEVPALKVSPFLCPICHKPVELEEAQFDSRGHLVHPACKAEQGVKVPKAKGKAGS